ncbi:MAG: carbohydrate-binding protein [Tepidisphaeraceae bacterium]
MPSRRVHSRAHVALEPLETRRLLSTAVGALPAYQLEALDRGLVAFRTGASTAYVGWRFLASDSTTTGFNVYRSQAGATPIKRNTTPITNSTNFADTSVSFTGPVAYSVRPVVNGVEQPAIATYTLPASAATNQYLNIPLNIPAGGTTPDGVAYTYTANDASVGDLDGDGQYEVILKWDPTNAKDNSQSGYTGNVYLDAYKLNGTQLWRIDLGRNIRAGAHYTQFLVYDFSGDGKAELACKTAPGTVDGAGNNVILGSDDPNADYRNSSGYILSGPEYLTVFNGMNGIALSTVNYNPGRGTVSSWGDSYGNRVDRFLATVAYLDGERPSMVFCRGYYTRAVLAAWDFRDGQLRQRWVFDTNTAGNESYRGQGSHGVQVADVDNDGRDEILYGAAAIDDNGTGLYNTTLGHGDAMHQSDLVPSRPGQEVYMVHETSSAYNKNGIDAGGDLRDARTGELLGWIPGGTADVGRGVAGDIDPRYDGAEMWSSADANMYAYDPNTTGPNKLVSIGSKGNVNQNFVVQWDGDTLYELLDGTTISDWRITNGQGGRYNYRSYTNDVVGLSGNNGTKNTPALQADLFGDWREEVIWRTSDNTALQIWSTTIATSTRLTTLMHDRQYRQAIAWQNVAYNQPPHTSYEMGAGTTATTTQPSVFYAGSTGSLPAGDTYQAESAALAGGTVSEATNALFNGTGYANPPTSGGSIQFNNVNGGSGGEATLRIRFALNSTTSRTGRLLINGVAQNIAFTPTGGWTAWQTFTLPITLARGTGNTIRLESTGQDLANIDQIRIEFPAVPTGSATSLAVAPVARGSLKLTWTDSASNKYGFRIWRSIDGATFVPVGTTTSTVTTFTDTALPDGMTVSYRVTAYTAGGETTPATATGTTPRPGDTNFDGHVDFTDMLTVASAYGTNTTSGWSVGDFNEDGVVNFTDLLMLAANYGN